MGTHFDIGYFKKKLKIRNQVAKKRTVINKINAWQLGKEYYDGNRLDGYGGFKYDGRWKKFPFALFQTIPRYPYLLLPLPISTLNKCVTSIF